MSDSSPDQPPTDSGTDDFVDAPGLDESVVAGLSIRQIAGFLVITTACLAVLIQTAGFGEIRDARLRLLLAAAGILFGIGRLLTLIGGGS